MSRIDGIFVKEPNQLLLIVGKQNIRNQFVGSQLLDDVEQIDFLK